MKFENRTIQLKNGNEVTIRQGVPADAVALMDTIKTYLADSEYIPKYPQEFRLTLEKGEDWIRSFMEKENSLLLIAEHEGRIVGNIDLTGSHRQMMQHTAMVGMGMLKDWRSIGLGTALLSAAIDWAKANPILELLWLQVYTDNSAGMALYHKMGFKDNGIIPRYFKKGARYYDNLTMSLSLD